MADLDAFERLRAWAQWLEVTDHRPGTVRTHRYWVIRFIADTLIDPWDATEDDFTGYIASMTPHGTGRRCALNAFRSYWGWAAPKAGRNPTERLHIRRQPTQRAPYLSPSEVRALIHAAFRRNPRRGWGILLMVSTGVRIGSLVEARLEDVRDGKLFLREAKGGHSYEVQLAPEAQLAVKNLAAERHETLLGVGAQQFRNWMQQAAKDAGLDRRVWPHLLRHTFATVLSRHADPETWRVAVGHADLSNWTRYVHPDEARVREAVESIQVDLLARRASDREALPEPEPESEQREEDVLPPRPVLAAALSVEEIRGRLTPAQLETLTLVAQDLTNPEIAYVRDISLQGVKQLLTQVYRRLGVRGRAQAKVIGQVLLESHELGTEGGRENEVQDRATVHRQR